MIVVEIQARNISTIHVISLRLRFRRNFLSVLHLNLVSSPIKGILEILNLTTRCIPMDILAWTDCVRSSAGKISYTDIFSNSNLQKYWYFLTFYSVYPVHAKVSIGVHRVVKFKISRIPLIGLETRLGWRTDRKFLRNPNLNEISIVPVLWLKKNIFLLVYSIVIA